MQKRIFIALMLIIIIFLSSTNSDSLAATYYVSINGNDAYNGRYPDYEGGSNGPFRTIAKGIDELEAGDTLFLRGGTYAEAVDIEQSGSASLPITIASYDQETAIIDGQHNLPAAAWDDLIAVRGNYVVIRDLHIKNSNWLGLVLYGDHNQAINLWVEGNNEQGILVRGDYCLVDNCDVHANCRHNENGAQAGGGWACALCMGRGGSHSIIQNCRSWDNWGEGISSWSSDYVSDYNIIQGCVSYNNWSNNIYLQNTQHTIVQRNLIYVTANNPTNNDSQQGIEVGDEYNSHRNYDNIIINNFVIGCDNNFLWWHSYSGDGLNNFVIANNTFVNSRSGPNLEIQTGGNHTNCIFKNNIVLQEDSIPIAIVANVSDIEFSHNLWSKTPLPDVSGPGDLVADPQLSKRGSVLPGSLTPMYFKILATSPAIDSALRIDAVNIDFFRRSRGIQPDIGGHEYQENGVLPAEVMMLLLF
jgi:hypothetical protein